MLDLHVQTTSQHHGSDTTVRTTRLRLRFVPIDLDILLVLRGDSSRISIATLKVVTDHKEKCEIDTTHNIDKKQWRQQGRATEIGKKRHTKKIKET